MSPIRKSWAKYCACPELINSPATCSFKPLEADVYAYGPPMFWPVIPPKEQIKDPEYRPVEDLVVAPGKTVLELRHR